MADALFALALVVPPVVVLICFGLIALPVRRERRRAHHTNAHAH